MKMTKRILVAIAVAAMAVMCAHGDVITIPENGTLTIGGSGDDPNNKQGNFIVFEPGSTLVVTQNVVITSAGNTNLAYSIWPVLIATNGAATVRGLNPSLSPVFQNHVFAYGDGSLTLEDMSYSSFGHSSVLSVLKVDNLRRGSGVGQAAFKNSTIISFPTDPDVYVLASDANAVIRLCGDQDMYPGQDTITVNRAQLHLCNPAAIPAGKTVSVANGRYFQIVPLKLPDYRNGIVEQFTPMTDVVMPYETTQTYGCDVTLSASATMMFANMTNATEVVYNGTISGKGNVNLVDYKGKHGAVVLAGDNSGFTGVVAPTAAGQTLVLSNANAVANATVRMDQPMALCGAEGIASVSVASIAGGTDTENNRLIAASNQTISVGSISASLSVSGGGAGAGSVVTVSTLEPNAVVCDDKTATVNLPAGTFRATKTEGDEEVVVMPGASGAFDASAYTGFTQMPTFEAPDGALIVNGTNSLTVSAAAGVEAHVAGGDGSVCSVAGDGAFSVDAMGLLIRETSWWFDFSRADTRFCVGYGATNIVDRYHAPNSQEPYIERVVDWRRPDDTYNLWNRRLYGTKFEYVPTVYSYLPTDTLNGLEYMSMGTKSDSRRLPFSDGTGKTDTKSCEAQLVVMVYGAQNGGGYAMVATAEGAFGRSGTGSANGMTTNTLHDIWKDGVKVADPTTTTFTKGWQVLSVALDGLHFAGLGFLKELTVSPKTYGGQNYCEVLVFTNAVSERVRLEAEWYLARKWGLDSIYSPDALARLKALRDVDPVRVAASGGVTVKAGESTVSVEGPFSGTVNLDGGKLVVADRSMPCTAADIPSEGRLYWADPDDEATLRRYRDTESSDSAERPDEVRAIRDKAARAFTAGQPALYGVGSRMPYLVRQSRGLGAERGWLDFNNLRAADHDGNCLRFFDYPSDSSTQTRLDKGENAATVASMLVRTAFVVQDSVRGGCSPLMHDVFGGSGIIRRATGKWTETIWPNNKPSAFVGGENRLNGETVDYRNGFTGKPEVFTVRGTAGYDTPFIGNYQSTEGVGKTGGELIGEVLLYSTALSDGAVKDIEAYLMGKWLGRLPEGYADIRLATVTGTGTVEVAVAAQMPKIGSGFEGTVEVADGAFVMNVDVANGTVSSTLDCPLATLDLPQNCSITLNFSERPPHPTSPVTYTLVNCAGGMDGVTWTFTAGANAPFTGVFVKSGNTILFRYAPKGSVFTFR